jgi:uncharacterized damage-inducible protein DinB
VLDTVATITPEQFLRPMGNSFNSIRDMLQYVVNHGTHHRGQITTMLRQLKAVPPKSMDLLAFYRERNWKA